ncbi:hypothetical protein A0H81_11573 [Grifola frondosa]|uniref:Uncharacterized protein n=1 Tax=Grifola frondosa TaxID=5627 RepID=A0A1C7LUX1_GRIFR|nr:hypothetical protein A0H81_11573 [Grifola frondosa]
MQCGLCRTEEPEFVEWGYDGMGCMMDGGVGSSVWARMQTENSSLTAKVADDEHDGTGMAWVKKRCKQREKEREERQQGMAGQNSEQEHDSAGAGRRTGAGQGHGERGERAHGEGGGRP